MPGAIRQLTSADIALMEALLVTFGDKRLVREAPVNRKPFEKLVDSIARLRKSQSELPP